METKTLVMIAAALAALESVLVLSGILQPVLTYSPGNIVFLIARGALMLYAGWSASGLKRAALRGAIFAATGVMVLLIAAIAGTAIHISVLGLSLPSQAMPLLYLIMLVMNTALGAIVALLAAFIAGLVTPRRPKPKTQNPERLSPKPQNTKLKISKHKTRNP